MTAKSAGPTRRSSSILSEACRTSKVARVRVMDITGFFSDMGHVVDVSRALRIGYDYGDDAPSASVSSQGRRPPGEDSPPFQRRYGRGGSSLKLIVSVAASWSSSRPSTGGARPLR